LRHAAEGIVLAALDSQQEVPVDSAVAIEVPSALAPLVQGVVDHLRAFLGSARASDTAPPDFSAGEAKLMGLTGALEAASIGQMLAALDPVAPRVEVGGVVYRRLNQDAKCTYCTLRGDVVVNRHLYREEGVRNGPTVVPMDLQAGIVDSRYTPAAAVGMARLAQAMPSREAEATCESLHVLPYSRSEHFRMGVEMGGRWDDTRDLAEPVLVRELALDEEAVSISLAVDRVSMPMAEARERTPDDVERGVKNPISVALRMAFSAVWTLYDAEGNPLQAVRYAHVPTGGSVDMEQSLSRDLAVLLERRPDMRIVTLADGAPEMQGILDRVVAGREVAAQLVDFWHVAEKLGTAIAATERYKEDLLGDWKAALLKHDAAIDDILSTLEGWSREYVPEEIPEDLHDALTYLTNNKDRMRYARVRAAGLPVGSGTVEATCKTIVDVRMKRAGCRWVEAERGPQAILGLRALATSEPTRWRTAMPHILASYKQEVTMLPARVGRATRQRPAPPG
jgi:hypothetical protein